ncbi:MULTISPECIES: LPS-assembly protein LptD [Psychrobacter]|uniref:LPS-assembly protein LptD n=1 Tax=Psychrobacter alimentarius TaxID=261164 RepID=A0ABN4N2G4_9GAMM|nr:LPS assembly protein LptD [Psychrobacter alimentarius]AMT96434.1 LPS-assembly protein LptD [Psychrobacter alimentarius]QCB31174.1 LPS-assembly protein LptD [Psychrobacter sp. PAMC27889]
MLYSPLYQSIRLILFGALGLSSLTVSAALNDVNTSQTELPITDNSATHSPDNSDFADSRLDTTNLNDNSLNSSALNNSDLNSNTLDSNALDITDIEENSDPQINTDVPVSETAVSDSITDATQSETSEESIQDSLMRLAEFYELTPDTDNSTNTPALDSADKTANIETETETETDDNQNALTPNSQTIPKVGRDLRLLPSSIDSAQRCEGQWVYPKGNPNYQRAVNEAGAANGQPAPNLDGLPNNQAPLFTESDYGYYNNVDYAELSGNVIVNQGTQYIEAEKVLVDLSTGVAAAQGKVMFTDQATGQQVPSSNATSNSLKTSQGNFANKASQGGLIGVADSLAYNTETGQSTANDVAFASVALQAHGYAKRLNKPNESQYELDEVMFSTCPPTNRKWQFDAKSIDLDTDTGRGEAYNTTFRIADVPVFYLPYFNFPIDSRRSSGFLLPSASIGSESGVELDVPYYFNLAPNYDATLNTHIYTDRNPMVSGEFRYLTENYGEGIFNGSYLPNDKEYNDEDRTSFFYDHYWTSKDIPRLSGDAKYSYVSDADYLNDFDTLGLSDSTINLPRRARVNYYNDYVDGELKVETFQTLDAFTDSGQPLQDKDKPYSRLPQLKLNYRLPWFENFDITGVQDSAYFKKSIDDGSENEKSGARIYNKLSAAYPIEKSWGYIRPKLSLQHLYTSYDEDSLADNDLSEEDGSQSVFVPQASIDAGLNFYQAGSPFGAFDDTMGGYRLLSPRLKYTYSPYKNQNELPNFNTRIASINYEQLFSDSWFLGHDRLQDLHSITPGVNYRYIDATGVTRFDGSIAEQFYIDDGRVTLENEQPVFTSSSSGMVWDTSTQPYNNFWVDVSGALTNDYDLNYITTELRYQPSENSLFNVGYVKRQRDENTNQLPLAAFTASAVFPINNSWRILAQGQYDHNRDKMLDSLVGVDYEDCCFGFAVYGRRYYNDLNVKDKPTQAIMAEIRLNGLGSGSSRLTRLLSDKVLGFEPVQTAWKD